MKATFARIAPASLGALLLAGLLAPAAAAQPVRRMMSSAPEETVLPPGGATVAMTRVHRLPFVEATINGHGPYRLIIDTGAPGLVVNQALADDLALPGPPGMPAGVRVRGGAGDTDVPATLARVETLAIGPAEFKGLLTVALDLSKVGPFDGVIGMGVFGDCLLRLDYPNERVHFEHGALRAEDADIIAYTTPHRPGSHPVIELTVEGTPRVFMIDTGMNGWFRFPPEYLGDARLRYGPVDGPSARMVGSSSRTRLARLDGRIGLGPHVIVDPVLHLHGKDDVAIIGSGCLGQFDVTFDAAHMLVRFRRDGDGPVVAPAERVLGFDVIAEGETLVIGDVIPGSPAETAGLRVGEAVVSIEASPIAGIYGTRAWSRLVERDRLRVVLRSADGQTREVTVPVFVVVPAARPTSPRGAGR